MENPFVREDHSGIIITAVAIGAIFTAAITYLYATKKGFAYSKKLSDNISETHEHALDYLEKKTPRLKKKKTNLHKIEGVIKS